MNLFLLCMALASLHSDFLTTMSLDICLMPSSLTTLIRTIFVYRNEHSVKKTTTWYMFVCYQFLITIFTHFCLMISCPDLSLWSPTFSYWIACVLRSLSLNGFWCFSYSSLIFLLKPWGIISFKTHFFKCFPFSLRLLTMKCITP